MFDTTETTRNTAHTTPGQRHGALPVDCVENYRGGRCA